MRETMSAKGTIRRLNLASPLIEVVHRAPASRVARWLTGGPCVKLGCLRAPTQVGSISVASPPLREAYTRSGLRSCSGALDRLSLKKA